VSGHRGNSCEEAGMQAAMAAAACKQPADVKVAFESYHPK
jgi:hypothetical protein